MFKINKIAFSKPIPFSYLLPNMITILGLLIGVTSIRLAIECRWHESVTCILVGGMIDGLDGRIARLLNRTSIFGAELDSLCDLVNFGVAPVLVLYLWHGTTTSDLLLWSAMLLFVSCMALRLARFNSAIFLDKFTSKDKYFSRGVPAPCGALLLLAPMIFDFACDVKMNAVPTTSIFIFCYSSFVSALVISRVPTLIIKHCRIQPKYLIYCIVLFFAFIIGIITYPWHTLAACIILYFLSIPCCVYYFNKMSNVN
ncbi:putative phosphatidylcholine/phosphatidylserine synthase [Rickettsiales endosymbiont of Paramecium tredecaurelia]|uniref:CDP-alcohol phosphatidyltransferase family protein n=1 Tax=Candidatus Sarmatiella mevalonica TaxID=2770581 RepID=UPI0019250B7D|nr:phosphatidylcholine/phosphatidylserine synthase [Candidatus Sarmatiella mevalonica]MBL3284168.1 putative phosphatidylcholine/phosphatidylserine synthase [Candidatus Sarmatiella mevalonica]